MKKAVFVVPTVLVVLGVVFILSYLLAAKSAARSDGWNQTRGTIEKVSEGTPALLEVTYRYQVAGRDYRSSRVTLGTLSKSDVPSRLQRYSVGRTVLIYTNPANPAEAVLELSQHPPRGPLVTGWTLVYTGIAAGVVFWWRSTRRRKKRVRRPGRPMSRLKPPAPVKRT